MFQFKHRLSKPLTFTLVRREDKTGVSGTGRVADGCIFPNGLVALAWIGKFKTCDVRTIDQLIGIHLHHGATEVELHDFSNSGLFDEAAEVHQDRAMQEVREYILAAGCEVKIIG